jgi:hypothetical protein
MQQVNKLKVFKQKWAQKISKEDTQGCGIAPKVLR